MYTDDEVDEMACGFCGFFWKFLISFLYTFRNSKLVFLFTFLIVCRYVYLGDDLSSQHYKKLSGIQKNIYIITIKYSSDMFTLHKKKLGEVIHISICSLLTIKGCAKSIVLVDNLLVLQRPARLSLYASFCRHFTCSENV